MQSVQFISESGMMCHFKHIPDIKSVIRIVTDMADCSSLLVLCMSLHTKGEALQQKCEVRLVAGFSGNQLLGGLLLHTTRNTHIKSCNSKFDKFTTSCIYNHTLYDAATGKVVVLPTTTGGLLPYGVDTFFLRMSATYDSQLVVCKSLCRHIVRCTVCLFVCLPACLAACLSVCLSVCAALSPQGQLTVCLLLSTLCVHNRRSARSWHSKSHKQPLIFFLQLPLSCKLYRPCFQEPESIQHLGYGSHPYCLSKTSLTCLQRTTTTAALPLGRSSLSQAHHTASSTHSFPTLPLAFLSSLTIGCWPMTGRAS